MSGFVYGVVTADPITGKPAAINADIDWTIGDAAVVADVMSGFVVRAERGPWHTVDQKQVAEAYKAHQDEVMEVELKKMLGGDK